jgi:cell division protein FtsN
MRGMNALLAGVVILVATVGHARIDEPDVAKYVSLVERGQAEQVRSELPALLSKYPNNPGVLYLQAMVTTDGAQAVRMYQSIVDNFPRSRWATDALFRVYQYYYALGLYRTAELKMSQLKRDYPESKYVTGRTAVETKNLPEEQQQPALAAPDSVVAVEPPSEEGVGENLPPLTTQTSGQAQQAETQTQFGLQVGAYGSQENAQKQKLFFENLGYPVGVLTKVKDARSLYTVVVGSYSSYDEAKAKCAEIKKKYNIDSFVVTR